MREKYKPSNYRPVSLICTCCKIQEHIVTSNVLKNPDEHNILTDCQRGFRTRRSCKTQLLTLADELVSGLDPGPGHKTPIYDPVVLDFFTAFDRVPHQRLGVRASTFDWIRQIEGFTPGSAEVLTRVPQRTVLGPLLFLVFI